MKNNTIYNSTQERKYLGISLTKYGHNLYVKNYKILMKGIKKYLNSEICHESKVSI